MVRVGYRVATVACVVGGPAVGVFADRLPSSAAPQRTPKKEKGNNTIPPPSKTEGRNKCGPARPRQPPGVGRDGSIDACSAQLAQREKDTHWDARELLASEALSPQGRQTGGKPGRHPFEVGTSEAANHQPEVGQHAGRGSV